MQNYYQYPAPGYILSTAKSELSLATALDDWVTLDSVLMAAAAVNAFGGQALPGPAGKAYSAAPNHLAGYGEGTGLAENRKRKGKGKVGEGGQVGRGMDKAGQE